MRKLIVAITGLLTVSVLWGCSSTHSSRYSSEPGVRAALEGASSGVRSGRIRIWKASLRLEVWNIRNAVEEAGAMAERQGGFVENKSDKGDESASLTLRIPAKSLTTTLSSLETLGSVTSRNVEGEDVTEEYIDVEARLKNKIVLRGRLKELLAKAVEVKDILAIETELNRVQAEIDSMEGRMKSLKGQVEYATVRLSLDKKTLRGPLGYFFKGLWWGVEKLF